MICRNCGNENAYHVRTIVEDGEMIDLCNLADCGNLSISDAGSPDVYLARAGQQFKNLCDDMGRPIPIQSKRHKKEVMDRLGVQEAAGTVNGQRFGSKSWVEGTRDYRKKSFDKDRPKIREVYKQYLDNVRRKS